MTGDYYMIKRISMYLLSLQKEKIKFAYKLNGTSISKLSALYNVSDSTMKKFLVAEKLLKKWLQI